MMVRRLLLFVILTLPLQFALNPASNIDLVVVRILVPALFFLWLSSGMARKKISVPHKTETALLALFLFFSFLSLAFASDWSQGARKALYLAGIFPVYLVTADLVRDKKTRTQVLLAIIGSGLIAAVVGIFQFSLPFLMGMDKALEAWKTLAKYFLGSSFSQLVVENSSWLVNVSGETIMRAFGFFPDPHNFAFFLNLCIFSALGYFFGEERKSRKIFAAAGVALMIPAVILSFSRGAYLGFLAGFFFFAIVFLRRAGILGKVLLATGVIAVAVLAYNSNAVSQRLVSTFNLREGSNAERYKNWAQAAEIIRDHPLEGVGLGNYARAVDPEAAERSPIYAHNLFLDIAAETGVLNAVVFLFLIIVSILRNLKNGGLANLGIAAGLFGFFVHSFFDTALYSPQVLTLLLVIIALGLKYDPKFSAKGGST